MRVRMSDRLGQIGHWTAAGLLLGGIGLVTAGGLAPAPLASVSGPADDRGARLEQSLLEHIGPLIETYCIDCHAGDGAEAGIKLDQLENVKTAHSIGLDLRLVRDALAAGQMPPKKKSQPSAEEREKLIAWLNEVIAYVPPDAPIDPGWFTIHRHNRTEYANTLRDLLGLEPAVAAGIAGRLPRDDMGYGFDNIADVLSISPLAVEQYLDAADKAVEAALGPVVEVGDHPKAVRPIKGQNGQQLSRGGFLLYSNGPAAGVVKIPITGEYIVRVRAWETRAGDEGSRMSVRVDRKDLKEFTVSGTREEPQEFEIRTRLKAGSRTISAAFLNDYYVKDVADRNLAIESITVAGPLDETGIERPAAWRALFGPGGEVADETSRAGVILGAFAERAYRRPASEAQVRALVKVFSAQRREGKSFEVSVRTAVSAALVSPSFLFRTAAHPDATNPKATYKLDGYELASRLSYFLWSSMPDGELLSAARDGSILTDAGLSAHVRRMLADARSGALVENFAGQWLQLRGLDAVTIDRSQFPEYTDELRSDMKAEATQVFGELLRSDLSVLELVQSTWSFLNERLAALYGVHGVEGGQLRRIEFPAGSARGGILTMGAVLTLTSNPTRTSPVKRGLFVLDQLLGAPPPPPPPEIPPLEQASAAAGAEATLREKMAAHLTVASCAACHRRLDPIGLTFEQFDAIGRWRESEGGKPVDASGELPGKVKLGGVNDLKRYLLERSDQFVETLSAKMLTYAIGRGMEKFDKPAVRAISARTRANGDRLSALIESVALSETFRTCRGRSPSHE